MSAQDRPSIELLDAMGIGLFSEYHETPNGWYKTDSPKSPMRRLPSGVVERAYAEDYGFRPARSNDRGIFISVVTCRVHGFRGVSSRAYVSRWVREEEK